jgi:hypothetical protein
LASAGAPYHFSHDRTGESHALLDELPDTELDDVMKLLESGGMKAKLPR